MDTSSSDFRKLRELVTRTGIAMLVTTDPQGGLRSRPVETQQLDEQGRLWFFTAADSPKVGEIDEHRGQVNLAYADPSRGNYASISGIARFYRDPIKIRELWHRSAEVWFPDGPDDPQLLLLQVTMEKAEYWDSPDSPVLRLWGLTRALATGNPEAMGRNRKLLGETQLHQSPQPGRSGPHPQQYR